MILDSAMTTYEVDIAELFHQWCQATCLNPCSPLLGVLFPLRPQPQVIRHVLVSEEQVLVPPEAGGQLGGEHQVCYVSFLAAQPLGGAPGEHPVQPGAGGEGHQLGEHIVRVVLREGEAAVWDKVEGEREHRVSNPHSVLTIP